MAFERMMRDIKSFNDRNTSLVANLLLCRLPSSDLLILDLYGAFFEELGADCSTSLALRFHSNCSYIHQVPTMSSAGAHLLFNPLLTRFSANTTRSAR